MQLSGNYFGNLGQAEYKIEVFNSDQECKIPVFVQLVGSQDMSVKKVNINQHFRFWLKKDSKLEKFQKLSTKLKILDKSQA